MENDQESPTSSPAPGPSAERDYDEEVSEGGEAEAVFSGPELVAGRGYLARNSPPAPSAAPTNSGLDAELDLLAGPGPLSRQLDSVLSCPHSSQLSSSDLPAQFASQPSTSRAARPSDPVISAPHLHTDMTGPYRAISSSWAGEAGGAGWDWQPGLPQSSCLEQAVPGQLTLSQDCEPELGWHATSSEGGAGGCSEENSLGSPPQSAQQFPFSPQPSSSVPAVSGSGFPPLPPGDPLLAPGPSSFPSPPLPEAAGRVNAKRSISFPDSPCPEAGPSKRPRSGPSPTRPDSPAPRPAHSSNAAPFLPFPARRAHIRTLNASLDAELEVDGEARPRLGSAALDREIENCLAAPGPSQPGPTHQPPRISFGRFGPPGPAMQPAPARADSPAPSESEEEAGPSYREAAPAGPAPRSPIRPARRQLSDSCLISSSTGPIDSNPPTPEMFVLGGDIDSDYGPGSPVPHRRGLLGEDEAVVDSTVDSTSSFHQFLLHSPGYGSEVRRLCESSEEDEGGDQESVAGSEASSTTSNRLEEQGLSLPGQDDTEGISTSGQVDTGQFRLVPNDMDCGFEAGPSGRRSGPTTQFVPELVGLDGEEENRVGESQQQQDAVPHSVQVFKRPYNKKGRLLDYQAQDGTDQNEAEAGPSHQLADKPGSSGSAGYGGGIGLAFSGLPGVKQDQAEPAPAPLSKRLRTRHFQEVAQASGQREPEPLDKQQQLTGGSEILRNSLEGKPRLPTEEAVAGEKPKNNGHDAGYSNWERVGGCAEGGEPSVLEHLILEEEEQPDAQEENAETEEENHRGNQQSFVVTLQTENIDLALLRPKKIYASKSCPEFEENRSNSHFDSFLLKSELEMPKKASNSVEVFPPKKRPAVELDVTEEEVAPLTITDQPVQSRAMASLPSNYLALRPVLPATQAVFALKTIPISCRFGPVEGRLLGSNETPPPGPLLLLSHGRPLDLSSEEESNWMRFIRPAESRADQNLELTLEPSGQLFYTSTAVIAPGLELRVWYSAQYAAEHGLPLEPSRTPVPTAVTRPTPKKNVDRHKNSSNITVARENIAEKTQGGSTGSRYSCNICSRAFERQASLSRHLALHLGTKNHECGDCGQKFSHTFNLERHRKKVHHSDPAGQFVRCTNCGVWFPSSMVLKVHMFSHHPNKEQQNWTVEDAMAQSGKEGGEQEAEEMKFQCPADGCGCQYDTWLELVEHAGEHGAPSLPAPEQAAASAPAGPVHKCELCYKTFATDERLGKHMAVHAGDESKPLECSDCGKRFLTNSALAGHVKTHAHPDTLYDCPICLLEFEQVSSLKDHVYIHKENGVFTCPHCIKTFNEYPQIRKHIRAFHAEKRFPCASCDKSFTGKDKLKIHMVRHSEAKEFMCDDCGKQFKRKDKLREHVKRMHTINNSERREVEAESEQDNPRFVPKVVSTDLHLFIYKCTTCMLGFKRRGMLVNHLAKRHPDVAPNSVPELNLPILKTTKDFYCQYCDKVYKSSSKRKSHILKIHPGAALPAGAREAQSSDGLDASTFSHTVGSVTSQPHNCDLCHKQYASKPKLLQHMRKKHRDQAGPSTSTRGGRPQQVMYIDPPSPQPPAQMIEELDGGGALETLGQLEPGGDLFDRYESEEFLLGVSRPSRDLLPAALALPSSSGPSRPGRSGKEGGAAYQETGEWGGARQQVLTVDPAQITINNSDSGTIIIEAPAGLPPSQLHHILESVSPQTRQ